MFFRLLRGPRYNMQPRDAYKVARWAFIHRSTLHNAWMVYQRGGIA